MKTVIMEFLNNVIREPDREIIFSGNTSLTNRQIYASAINLSKRIENLGLKKGDRIGILLPKNFEKVISITSCLMNGYIFIPIPITFHRNQIDYVINNSGARLLITNEIKMKALGDFKLASILLNSEITIENVIDNEFVPPNIVPDDVSNIIYTSGSTGFPKGVTITHRVIYDGTVIVSHYLNITKVERILGMLSFDFDYGLNQLWMSLVLGSRLFLHDFSFTRDLFSEIVNRQITMLPGMPVFWRKIFDSRFWAKDNITKFSSLRLVCTSGGKISPEIVDCMKKQFEGAEIILMYGLTEAFRSTYLPFKYFHEHPDSIGMAIPGVEILVLDENGQECPTNTPGQLVHRGALVTKGYWNDSSNTNKLFKQREIYPNIFETVVYSGDLVRRDEKGLLYFIGRMDEMIKTEGYRVSPHHIEKMALEIPDLEEAIVFGFEEKNMEQSIVLNYTTISKSELREEAILSHFRKTAPGYMVPRYIRFWKEFPVTKGNEGKFDRSTIKKHFIEQHHA